MAEHLGESNTRWRRCALKWRTCQLRSQEQQTRGFLERVINDTEPQVPLEVPHHHVEVVRAIYKSSEENQPVALPLDKDDPWYSFKGRFAAGRKPSS